MEIGSDYLDEGITYPEFIKKLKTKHDDSLSRDSQINILKWFIENFSNSKNQNVIEENSKFIEHYIFFLNFPEKLYKNDKPLFHKYEDLDLIDTAINQREIEYNEQVLFTIEDFHRDVYYLRGSTNKQYLDYLELKESRESSQKALRKANISILVAVIALLISAGFSVAEYFKPEPSFPKPPYDVKIIEPIEIKQTDTTKIK